MIDGVDEDSALWEMIIKAVNDALHGLIRLQESG